MMDSPIFLNLLIYIKHPSEVVSVGDIVDCYVTDISVEKEKVSLSLIEGK